jgi:hypothetical protein
VSTRKASGTSRARTARVAPSAGRAIAEAIGDPAALFEAFETAEILISQIRTRGPRGPKAVTLDQALRAVVLILVSHLSGFDYRKAEGSPSARTARMLAALSVVLADAVSPKRTR